MGNVWALTYCIVKLICQFLPLAPMVYEYCFFILYGHCTILLAHLRGGTHRIQSLGRNVQPKWIRLSNISTCSIQTGPLSQFPIQRFHLYDLQTLTTSVEIWCIFFIKWDRLSNGWNLGQKSQVAYNLEQKWSYVSKISQLNIENLGQWLKVP